MIGPQGGGGQVAGSGGASTPEDDGRAWGWLEHAFRHATTEMYVRRGPNGSWVRRVVERFPNAGVAREVRDLESGRFELVSMGEMQRASGGIVGGDGELPENEPLVMPPQPVQAGLRSRPIGRMNAGWGGQRVPVRGPPGPAEDDPAGSDSSEEEGPGRFG